MSEENRPKGQDESETAVAENRLTYADLLNLEWVLGDQIGEWEWRGEDLEYLAEKGRAILGRIREMIRLDEEGGES